MARTAMQIPAAALTLIALGVVAPGWALTPPRLEVPERASLWLPDVIIADGRVYTRGGLDKALREFDAHFHGDLYGRVMGVAIDVIQSRFAAEK